MNLTDRWLQGTAWAAATRYLKHPRTVIQLRLVLGGPWLPLSLASWCTRFALWLVPIILVGIAGRAPQTQAWLSWRAGAGAFAVIWTQICSLGLIISSSLLLRRQWRHSRHGLSLVRLLPGLGESPQTHRDLLNAAVTPQLRWLLILGLAALIASISAARGALAALFVFANVFGNGLTWLTLALYTLSGRKLPTLALSCILANLVILSLVGFALPDWLSHRGMLAAAAGLPFFGLLWLSHYGAMAWMMLMGWANLFDRPHPFLANP